MIARQIKSSDLVLSSNDKIVKERFIDQIKMDRGQVLENTDQKKNVHRNKDIDRSMMRMKY